MTESGVWSVEKQEDHIDDGWTEGVKRGEIIALYAKLVSFASV